jgi:hypothetical protein
MTFSEIAELITAVSALGAVVLGVRNGNRIQNIHLSIDLLEKNTNSIKDALVASTAKASFAEGMQQERDSRK